MDGSASGREGAEDVHHRFPSVPRSAREPVPRPGTSGTDSEKSRALLGVSRFPSLGTGGTGLVSVPGSPSLDGNLGTGDMGTRERGSVSSHDRSQGHRVLFLSSSMDLGELRSPALAVGVSRDQPHGAPTGAWRFVVDADAATMMPPTHTGSPGEANRHGTVEVRPHHSGAVRAARAVP